MADFNFQALQGGEYNLENTAPYEENNYGDSEEDDDYDPSNLQFSMNDLQPPVAQEADGHITSSINLPDPSTAQLQQQGLDANAPTKKRTVGGFVDDDDDEERNTDRIAADPRGDTDAWMSLIDEYKRRNKLVETYETYDRFCHIFPTSVSTRCRHPHICDTS